MAGTVTIAEQTFGTLKKITFTWVSSAGGAADGVTTKPYSGEILVAEQIPDGGGTQPTALYDVTVVDSDGIDQLGGLGADLSNAVNTFKHWTQGLGAVATDVLTLHVTNAGAAKGGKTILFIR